MTLKIKKTHPNAITPKRATSGSAGMDLYAVLDEPLEIKPGQRVMVDTGIAISLPTNESVGLVFARSGLAIKQGITLANAVGVIDSDYTGPIKVGLINMSDTPYKVQPNERIAQLVVSPVLLPKIMQVDDLEETKRGDGGFGSTGRK